MVQLNIGLRYDGSTAFIIDKNNTELFTEQEIPIPKRQEREQRSDGSQIEHTPVSLYWKG